MKNAVTDLSFTAEPGDIIGIIGGTGSGKSSITNLIPRFYDVSSGEILINDHNIKKYRVEDIRNIIGLVPQNPTLFTGTIRSNMCWRKPDASDEEIIKALKIAQAYDFVKDYPDFLEHHVNRGGTNFSGGQRQRLTIARALVGNPHIIILDDASSALDFATDAKLRKAIRTSLSTATTFIVTQRTNSIKDANKTIVIDNGKVVDIGTHEELLERCQVYQEIHYSQNKKETK
jgi:ATP-binding cassette subfamily B protein